MTKKQITQILTITIFFSCSSKELKNENHLANKWEIDSLEIGFVHGVFDATYNDSTEINVDFITPDFRIDLNDDFTFRIENEDKSIDEGVYHYSSDSIILKKDNYEWLKFLVMEQTDSTLKLSTDRIRFYHVDNDSIQFFTGDELEFKKVGNTIHNR